jgi:hypothetical protein
VDLHRRKLWGDRFVWLLVVAATVLIVSQWMRHGDDIRLYLLVGWSVVMGLCLRWASASCFRRRCLYWRQMDQVFHPPTSMPSLSFPVQRGAKV